MNLHQWRQDPTLIEKARKIQDGSTFKVMMEILNEELPTNHVLPVGCSSTDFAYHYGMEVGYRRPLGTLKAMAHPSQQEQDDLVADFAQPLDK